MQQDDTTSFGQHLYGLEQSYAVIAIRRIVRPSVQGVSLLGTLKDFKRFPDLALRAFPALPGADEVEQDFVELNHATKDIVDLSDTIFAHADRNQTKALLWGLTKVGLTVAAVLQVGAKYVRLLADYDGDFEGEITSVLATKRDVRRFFGAAFIADDDEIPDELLKSLIETREPVSNPDRFLARPFSRIGSQTMPVLPPPENHRGEAGPVDATTRLERSVGSSRP